MSPAPPPPPVEPKKIGTFAFVLAGLAFIPMLGLLFGLIAIFWGLLSRRSGGKTAAAIGACGIAFTILVYGGLFYFGMVQRGGIYDDLRAKLAQNNLNAIVKSIEFYRVSKGQYPDTLDELKKSLPKDSSEQLFIMDPRSMQRAGAFPYFYYKKVDQGHYYLRAVGANGDPFSSDSLGPQIGDLTNIGLLNAPPKSPGEPNPR